MRTTLALMLTLATLADAQDGTRKPEPAAEKFDLARTGIEWNKGLESALNKGKPVLLFQLLGNFDDVFC